MDAVLQNTHGTQSHDNYLVHPDRVLLKSLFLYITQYNYKVVNKISSKVYFAYEFVLYFLFFSLLFSSLLFSSLLFSSLLFSSLLFSSLLFSSLLFSSLLFSSLLFSSLLFSSLLLSYLVFGFLFLILFSFPFFPLLLWWPI